MIRTTYIVLILMLYRCSLCGAATLYTLNTSGALLTVDQQTGSSTPVLEDLVPGSWTGLTPSPTDNRILFAIHNPRPPTFDDPKFSRLAQINLDTKLTKLFPFFDWDALGFEDGFSTGIAISPTDPTTAVVVGNDLGIPPTPYVWEVDVATGQASQPARPLTNVGRIESISFDLDGETLYGTNEEGHLITIDLETADVTTIGDPGLSLSITGLAFHPDSGVLFGVDGRSADRLVQLDPTDASTISVLGPLGIIGPEGLAFTVDDDFIDPLDCSLNGAVDADDLECANSAGITDLLLAELGLFPGDLDGMNGVTFRDFVALASHYTMPTDTYTEGDITGDGWVRFDDFLTLAENYGRGTAVAAVPEPDLPPPLCWVIAAACCMGRTRSPLGRSRSPLGRSR